VIERLFGVLKGRFRILRLIPKYQHDIQRLLPPALAAVYNALSDRGIEDPNDFDYVPTAGSRNVTEQLDSPEHQRAEDRRDKIAQSMWKEYVAERYQ
jgi:hypothetical protein